MNYWTDAQEELLKKWYNLALAKSKKHSMTALYFFSVDRSIGISSVSLTGISGTSIFASLNNYAQCNEQYGTNFILLIVIGTILILSAILGGVQNFLSLKGEAEKHSNISNRLKNFADSIESELALPREIRIDGKLFVKHAQKRLAELTEVSLDIPHYIEKKYIQLRKNNKDSTELTPLSQIIINKEIYNIRELDNNARDINESDSGEDDNRTSNDKHNNSEKDNDSLDSATTQQSIQQSKPHNTLTLQDELKNEIVLDKLNKNLKKLQEEQKRLVYQNSRDRFIGYI